MDDLRPSNYAITSKIDGQLAVWSTRSGLVELLDDNEARAFLDGDWDALSELQLERMREGGHIVSASKDELAEVLAENTAEAECDPVFDVVITPSSNCPLGCNMPRFGGYCGQHHAKGQLGEDEASKTLAFVTRSLQPYHTSLRVTWFGGEPLLAMSAIRSLTQQLRALAAGLGLSFDAGVVTGGTLLTRDVVRELYQALSVRSASITLDGIERTHDLRRPTKSGKATFQRIISNLEAIVGDVQLDGFQLSVRCNVDHRNADHAHQLIDFLSAKGWSRRIELYFAFIHPWGDASASKLTPQAFADLELNLESALIKAGFPPKPLPTRKRLVCRVVSRSRAVIGHDAVLHRCTETPLTPVNLVNDSLGSVGDIGTLAGLEPWDWHAQIAANEIPCSRCAYLPVCGGACPLSWRTGSDVPCPPYKYNGQSRLGLYATYLRVAREEQSASLSRFSVERMLEQAATDGDEQRRVQVFLRDLEMTRGQGGGEVAPKLSSKRWVVRKLAQVAEANTYAYRAYKAADLPEAANQTVKAIETLQLISQAEQIEVRPAQAQSLVNLLAAQHSVTGKLDDMLGSQLQSYLVGQNSLRVGGVYMKDLSGSGNLVDIVAPLSRQLQLLRDVALPACY